MSLSQGWARGGLRAGSGLSPSNPIQLRSSLTPGLAALSRRSPCRQQPFINTSVLLVASSATALDADTSNGFYTQPGPIGQLGFSTSMKQDFHTTGGQQLGKGAYGTVNLVVDRRTGFEYACKSLPKTRGRLTPAKTAKKIWAEVNILSRVQQCSNVARLHAVYEDDTNVYIVQEVCRGGDLDALLADHGPFTERQAALVLYECLRVIATCHKAGVVHGDVKPANFLLKQRMRNPLFLIESGTATGWLKAIDFGCSQEDRGVQLSRRTGTPVYMAPEVFTREYSRSADMWSLGMMLYQFMSCRFPFWTSVDSCREKSLDQVARAVCMERINFETGPFEGMSDEGIDLLSSLLERNPVQRATAAEALAHPWFTKMLKKPPPVNGSNNVVPLQKSASRRQQRQQLQPLAPAAATVQQSVARVGRSYPSPTAVASFAF